MSTRVSRAERALKEWIAANGYPCSDAEWHQLVEVMVTAAFEPTGAPVHARISDPSTSHHAYQRMKADSQSLHLLLIFRNHPGGLTAEEASGYSSDLAVQRDPWKRCSDLKNGYGYLETLLDASNRPVTRVSSRTNKPGQVLVITPAGRAAAARLQLQQPVP